MARILIVEDEVLINKHITDELMSVGHKCISAFDGEEALLLLNRNVFDLVILDVMLPKLSGFERIKYIKSIPVIFVTARADLKDRLRIRAEEWELGKLYFDYLSPRPEKIRYYLHYYDIQWFESTIEMLDVTKQEAITSVVILVTVAVVYFALSYILVRRREV